jgi:hypothetical protein
MASPFRAMPQAAVTLVELLSLVVELVAEWQPPFGGCQSS